ncbi:MAG TPA: metallophosphoesterase [Candidatus Acidoferrales bacterium]|nr:metallophosphoesterase [Candidatus Acidoferrales bacterium]
MTNDFTFVWIGDPHLEGPGQPTTWINQANWIVKNIPTYNIQAVLCAGDMFMCPGCSDCQPAQLPLVWDDGSGKGLVAIDSSGVPYLVAAGNHDIEGINGAAGTRNTTSFDTYIGHDKISMKPWYDCFCPVKPCTNPDPIGGCTTYTAGPSLVNQAIKFDVGGRHVIVIALEYAPRPEVMVWAGDLTKKYPDHEVIILVHAYMDITGYFVTHERLQGVTDPKMSASGPDIFNWAKHIPNLKAILGGHSCGGPLKGGEAHRADMAADGHPLLGIYSDYQSFVPNSHVVLLLQVSGSQVKVCVFDTNANLELTRSLDLNTSTEGTGPTVYPYLLPWGDWPMHQPGLCIYNGTLYAAWKGLCNDQLWYSYFDGTKWQSQMQIPGVASSVGPSLAVFNGELYAVWKGKGDDQGLWWAFDDFRKYGGVPGNWITWSPQARIPGVASTIGPSLAVFNGKLYAAWKGAYFDTNDQRLWYATFDGENWSPQAQMPVGESSVGPSLAVFNGKLYAAWKGAYFDTNDQRLWYATFDGENWSPQAQIPAVAPGTIPLSSIGPSLAVFKGKLYAAWKGAYFDTNHQRLWYASYDGSAWSPQAQIPGVASSVGPSLAVFNGELYAVWKGKSDDVRLLYTSFDGANWTPQAMIPHAGSGPDSSPFITAGIEE